MVIQRSSDSKRSTAETFLIRAFQILEGNIYVIDRRNPIEIVKQFQAGNTVHKLYSHGSQIYAACEDGYLRVFNIKETA